MSRVALGDQVKREIPERHGHNRVEGIRGTAAHEIAKPLVEDIHTTAIIVFGLVLFPAFFSIWISFRDVNLGNLNDVFNAPFTGLDNYTAVVNDFAFKYSTPTNLGAFLTSIVFSFAGTIVTVLMGLGAALLLNQPFRARGLSRAIFLFPYVAPVVSVAFVWRWMLDPKPSGIINHALLELNLIDAPIAYLAKAGWALLIVIIFEGWRDD